MDSKNMGTSCEGEDKFDDVLIYAEAEVKLHAIFSSALNRAKWSAPHTGHYPFPPLPQQKHLPHIE
jgi:hypothetical protein